MEKKVILKLDEINKKLKNFKVNYHCWNDYWCLYNENGEIQISPEEFEKIIKYKIVTDCYNFIFRKMKIKVDVNVKKDEVIERIVKELEKLSNYL